MIPRPLRLVLFFVVLFVVVRDVGVAELAHNATVAVAFLFALFCYTTRKPRL